MTSSSSLRHFQAAADDFSNTPTQWPLSELFSSSCPAYRYSTGNRPPQGVRGRPLRGRGRHGDGFAPPQRLEKSIQRNPVPHLRRGRHLDQETEGELVDVVVSSLVEQILRDVGQCYILKVLLRVGQPADDLGEVLAGPVAMILCCSMFSSIARPRSVRSASRFGVGRYAAACPRSTIPDQPPATPAETCCETHVIQRLAQADAKSRGRLRRTRRA